MEQVRKMLPQLGICIGLLVIIWGSYLFGMKKINQTIENVLEDDFSWMVQVDEVRTEGNEFVLEGFAFKLGQDAEDKAFDIVLHNLDTDEYLFPRMEYGDRKDVNDYFLCEYDYTKSGFRARIKEKKLDLLGADYEIMLFSEELHTAYCFETYLSAGNLMYTSPKKYTALDVHETYLEKIVEDGILRLYRPDEYIYVYQYDGELYWIVEEGYEFNDNNDSYMQWHLTTTQIHQLPDYRVENNWTFDNLGFWFSQEEMEGLDVGKYRVAKRKLPTEYSILLLSTGKYEEEWIWSEEFRPIYEFD